MIRPRRERIKNPTIRPKSLSNPSRAGRRPFTQTRDAKWFHPQPGKKVSRELATHKSQSALDDRSKTKAKHIFLVSFLALGANCCAIAIAVTSRVRVSSLSLISSRPFIFRRIWLINWITLAALSPFWKLTERMYLPACVCADLCVHRSGDTTHASVTFCNVSFVMV